jgi:hypothetical protein
MEIMIFQSVIDVLTYKAIHGNLSNAELATDIVIALSSLAFISSQFGGLASQGEGSFPEYKRLFYTAMDIIAPSSHQAENLVQRLSADLMMLRWKEVPIDDPTILAKATFYLSVVEQVVGQISVQCLQADVLPICQM